MKKCLALLKEDYSREERRLILADQDALNIVLYENYYRLDEKWNYQPQYLWRIEDLMEDIRGKYVLDQKNAVVFHYVGEKPWDNPDMPQADRFWKCAKETDIAERLTKMY